MPEGDPAGYLPRIQRKRAKLIGNKRKPKPVQGQKIGRGLTPPPRQGSTPRSFQPVPSTPNPKKAKQRVRNGAGRMYRSRRSA